MIHALQIVQKSYSSVLKSNQSLSQTLLSLKLDFNQAWPPLLAVYKINGMRLHCLSKLASPKQHSSRDYLQINIDELI